MDIKKAIQEKYKRFEVKECTEVGENSIGQYADYCIHINGQFWAHCRFLIRDNDVFLIG